MTESKLSEKLSAIMKRWEQGVHSGELISFVNFNIEAILAALRAAESPPAGTEPPGCPTPGACSCGGGSDAVEKADNERASDVLMSCADFFAATLAKADDRAWTALMTYRPDDAVAKAVEAEREACAKIAQDNDGHFTWAGTDKGVAIRQQVASEIAAAIQARATSPSPPVLTPSRIRELAKDPEVAASVKRLDRSGR